MDYLDSVSHAFWGKLLLTFVPSNLALFITDLFVYGLLPLGVLLLLISVFKKKTISGTMGAWRSCGRMWLQIGLLFLVFNIVLYCLYKGVLTASLSGLRSFQVQYREDVLGAQKGTSSIVNIQKIATKFRNPKRTSFNPSGVKNSTGNGTSQLDEISSDLSKKDKLSAEEIKANLDSDISSDLNSAPVTLSSVRSKEYKVVEFFYKGYSWLHHLLYALAWLIFTAWFFWPGIKMQKQKTIIKH